MKKVTLTIWLDEAIYAEGALKMALEKTEQFREETKDSGCTDVTDFAIEVYKRAIESFRAGIESRHD